MIEISFEAIRDIVGPECDFKVQGRGKKLYILFTQNNKVIKYELHPEHNLLFDEGKLLAYRAKCLFELTSEK